MSLRKSKKDGRVKRHRRVRKKVSGTQERPRLVVFRSNLHIYAQVVNDSDGKTLVAASSIGKGMTASGEKGGNLAAAENVGKTLASKALKKGIKKVVFDRGGYLFHGRVKKLADAARATGLIF